MNTQIKPKFEAVLSADVLRFAGQPSVEISPIFDRQLAFYEDLDVPRGTAIKSACLAVIGSLLIRPVECLINPLRANYSFYYSDVQTTLNRINDLVDYFGDNLDKSSFMQTGLDLALIRKEQAEQILSELLRAINLDK